MEDEKYINVNRTKIRVIEKGEGKYIFLFHGARFNAETWLSTNTIDSLVNSGFKVVSVDFPGFGKSERGNYYNLSEFIKDLVLTYNVDKAYYLGASMGGEAVLGFAVNNPDFVEGLILVGPVGVEKYKEKLKVLDGKKILLIWGKNDNISPISNAELILNNVKTAKLVYVGNNHVCYLDDPKKFNEEIIKFLKE
ncbi:2-hydroxy-6-oxononadienedioate/2-hydroxy-6-oxononatrienedioate hydrolase [Nanoarchaeota archaeon]